MNKKTAITLGGIVLGVAVLSISTVTFFRYQNAPPDVEPVIVEELSIPKANILEKEESSVPVSVPPIKAEAKAVIEEPTVSKPEDSVPPPEVIETTDQNGGVVQTPNWEAQKELAPGTDLKNPDKQPEYVKQSSSKATSSQAASSKPQATASSSSKTESSVASSKSSSHASSSSKTESSTASSKSSAPASNSSKAESSAASSKQSGSTPKNGDTKTEDGQTYTYLEGFGWVKNGNGNKQTNVDVELSGEKVGH